MEMINLPWDMIEEILSRVPAKSLARLRSTSKQWNALSKSGSFARKHSANALKEESLSIMLIHSRVSLVRINLHGIHDDNVAPSVNVAAQFELKDPLSNSSRVDICQVFHCDGLLLCTTKDDRLVVWNPCSGATKWIQPRDGIYKKTDIYALGYDNDSSCKKYKILSENRGGFQSNEYEIYDFTSDSWRVVVANDWWLPFNRQGISVKGNTYWIAFDDTQVQIGPHFLLSFDFSTEKFQSLSLPHPFDYRVAALSLNREEQLCLLGSYDSVDQGAQYSSALHVWVTASTGPVMSWIKFLTVEDISVSFANGLSFLADEENHAVMCCNQYSAFGDNILHIVAEHKHIRHVVRPGGDFRNGLPHRSVLLNYVPSLAQIQQGTLLGD